MADHKDLEQAELHEPKGMGLLNAGSGDIGKVVVSKGDGTTETRKLTSEEVEGLEGQFTYKGVYVDETASTQTVDVATELKKVYAIGANPTAVVSVALPPAASVSGIPFTLKRLDDNHPDGSQVKFVPDGSETIDGLTEAGIVAQGNAITIVSDGTEWRVVESHLINTGWELYADATYGVGTELTVLDGVNTKLTIDGLGSLTNTTHKVPISQPSWNTTTNLIEQHLNGQLTFYRLFLYATPNAVNVSLAVEFQIAGSFVITGDTVRLARGSGVRQQVVVTVPIFADTVSLANGIQINVEPIGGDVDIDTITLLTTEQHLPREI